MRRPYLLIFIGDAAVWCGICRFWLSGVEQWVGHRHEKKHNRTRAQVSSGGRRLFIASFGG
eukprot:7316451-Lingulodinium_polyedra.AAC.1